MREANDDLRQLSSTDGLTQIANRRYLDERLEREWKRHRRDRQSLAILICDIDYFKQYNDTYGHLEGDTCLVRIARALESAAGRPDDLVARFGGEEFAIVLPNTDAAGVRTVAGNIRTQVEALRIAHSGSTISPYVTLSIGACHGVPVDDDITHALAVADRGLYTAKDSGRNQVVVSAIA